MKRAILFLIKLGVTVMLFLLLFRPETFGLSADTFGGVTPRAMWEELQGVEKHNIAFWLTFALVVKLAGMLAGVVRWRLLLQGQGLHMPFWHMVGTWFVGRTIGIFLPGTIGLDGYRLYDSSRYTGEVIKSATVIAIEKLIGIVALTGLVFLTFPLGFKLLDIRLPVLLVILTILAGMVTVALLLLLNPRVIQVMMAVIPTPGFIRNKLNKLGAAATAYSGNRRHLLLAVFFGFLVHVGTVFMYFGTMMAIRAANTSLFDILYAAPIMIYGTVIGPSVGGEGIREVVFAVLLSGKEEAATTVTFAHLGWWIGELIPFLIGIPVFLMRRRPGKEQLEAELAEERRRAAAVYEEVSLDLSPAQVSDYRRKVFGTLGAGLLGGLAAGALIGLAESGWLLRSLSGLTESGMFTWGSAVYGLLFACVGVGVAGGLLFLYLLFDRFASWVFTYAASFAGALAAGGLVIGLWRFKRDVLQSHAGSMAQYARVGVAVFGVALVFFVLAFMLAWAAKRSFGRRPAVLIGGGLGVYVLLVAVGALAAGVTAPAQEDGGFRPAKQAAGPNIIFVAIDALRADYLKLYDPAAETEIPELEAFARDSVLFEHSYAQASWTKPSFATLFTGLYPEQHTAYTKTAALPDSVVTLAELLSETGYYTKGFSNNPNNSSVFNFQQGYADYVDLKPSLYFGASPSASKLSMYNVLRMIRHKVFSRLGVNMRIEDFYQPAEVVTQVGLDWLDEGAVPEGTPFYLFLHYMDPHDPFMDPDAPEGGYARARMENPPAELEGAMRKAYNLEIARLDKALGVLFEGLKDRGIYDDALIVFASDHGEEFFDHEGWWHGQTLYDELVHVPILLKLPGNQHAGVRNPDMARHIDLPPTMLHFAGAPVPEDMPGQPLYDKNGNLFTNQIIGYSYGHNDFEGNILHGVRSKTMKFNHANPDNPRNIPTTELFDLEKDPDEKHNLAEDAGYRSKLEELEATINQYEKVIRENAAEPVGDADISGEALQQLEALGYLE